MSDRRLRLEGKVAIVTGAGSSGPGIGNGKAMAVLFAREGARVVLADQVAERARETLDVISSEGGEAEVVPADVTSDVDCARMVETAKELYGGLDILVNNVGISNRATVEQVTEEEWDRIMAVNVKSMVLTGRRAVPAMRQRGGGAIVNIASTAGLRASRLTPYSTSKSAVIGLTIPISQSTPKTAVLVGGGLGCRWEWWNWSWRLIP